MDTLANGTVASKPLWPYDSTGPTPDEPEFDGTPEDRPAWSFAGDSSHPPDLLNEAISELARIKASRGGFDPELAWVEDVLKRARTNLTRPDDGQRLTLAGYGRSLAEQLRSTGPLGTFYAEAVIERVLEVELLSATTPEHYEARRECMIGSPRRG